MNAKQVVTVLYMRSGSINSKTKHIMDEYFLTEETKKENFLGAHRQKRVKKATSTYKRQKLKLKSLNYDKREVKKRDRKQLKI